MRYAIVGTGMMGREHLANIAHIPESRVVSLVDPNSGSLERAAQVQIYAMSTGRPLKHIPQAVVEHTREQFRTAPKYGNRPAYDIHFEALMRVLDKSDTGYRN